MRSKFKYLILFTISILVLIALMKFGRSLYMPAVHRLKGTTTVEEKIKEISPSVRARLKTDLDKVGLSELPKKLLLVGLKEEQKLEVYFEKESNYQLLKSYPFTTFSGTLGPKLKEGDRQIPEGIYEVEGMNPNSSYHLSIKINFPNKFDLAHTEHTNPIDIGSDIFIHGKDVSIGCIAIGDAAIEELFLMVAHTRNSGVPIIISPRDFRTNPDFPIVNGIIWEDELYREIQNALERL